jgi:adenine-specific DNA methylase
MTNNNTLKRLKIEDPLPVTAVGIESIKESYSDSMSPHRKIFNWSARRPTATTRLAILASLLPQETSNEELLKLMCVGPKREINGEIEDYIISKEMTKDDRDGSIEDHFGYKYPHSRVPSKSEIKSLHNTLREHWDGDIPRVVDPTAGGATIPFEAARYGLPTVSNELNPVAWLINKVVLEHAEDIGSLRTEVEKWSSKIQQNASQRLSEYYPSRNGVDANYYYLTYSIECPSCGEQLPLSNRWWFNRSKDIAVKPMYPEDGLTFECIDVSERDDLGDFDPNDGSVDSGDAECPNCGVVTERDTVVERFQANDYEIEVGGVKFVDKINGTKYHSPTSEDHEAIEQAENKVASDLKLNTILREDRHIGYWDGAAPYGISQWRDLFTSRQLLAHTVFLEEFDGIKPDILDSYDDLTAEAILVLLSFISTRIVNYNSRLCPIHVRFGYVSDMLGNNNLQFQWNFGETNPLAGGQSYPSFIDSVLDNYENTVAYYPNRTEETRDTKVLQGDGSMLSVESESVPAVVIDPPYGDNIVYSEIADPFYVWLREYLGDIFPDQFSSRETNREDEAVENPSAVEVGSDESEAGAARKKYESKMKEIFSESYRILEPGGVITVYFTDKEISAWDSLTMSLMNAGFTITSTHTISTEIPDRLGQRGQSSADSSLLLSCRKPLEPEEEGQPTLWQDIQEKTRSAAREKASKLLDSTTNLTKTDIIISAFGPTLREFTEAYPVVDKYDELVRPKKALEEARKAVTEVLIERELGDELDEVDSVSRWYLLSWLVYENDTIPYDEARQLGLGVGVNIEDIKTSTKIWGKSGDKLILKGQNDRVRDIDKLEAGEKRRKRAYPIDPRDETFDYHIDAIHASLNVLDIKGGEFAWNWLKERNFQESNWFAETLENLVRLLPEDREDHRLAKNLASGQTGDLLNVDIGQLIQTSGEDGDTTLKDFKK